MRARVTGLSVNQDSGVRVIQRLESQVVDNIVCSVCDHPRASAGHAAVWDGCWGIRFVQSGPACTHQTYSWDVTSARPAVGCRCWLMQPLKRSQGQRDACSRSRAWMPRFTNKCCLSAVKYRWSKHVWCNDKAPAFAQLLCYPAESCQTQAARVVVYIETNVPYFWTNQMHQICETAINTLELSRMEKEKTVKPDT